MLVILGSGLVWFTTFHPADLQAEAVACTEDAAPLQPGQTLKVLNWNVQYMAGKGYVFFYDLPDNSGPDERPSREAVAQTFAEVARVIREEDPDLVLLQEVDDGADRTDGEDQLARLLGMLPSEYVCHTSAFYWKAAFVPHPRILGAVGMKLSIVSKYRITSAQRHQLALMPADPLTQQFNFKRAVLEARLPIAGGGELAVLNTHLDAFAQGSDTMTRQVQQVDAILSQLTQAGLPWLIGGDFNLLPPTPDAYQRLIPSHQSYYNPETEIIPLYERYQAVPSLAEVTSPEYQRWFTHYPNDPAIAGPDRTIDYLFLSPALGLGEHYVRQHDTLTISDHLPLIAEITLP